MRLLQEQVSHSITHSSCPVHVVEAEEVVVTVIDDLCDRLICNGKLAACCDPTGLGQ